MGIVNAGNINVGLAASIRALSPKAIIQDSAPYNASSYGGPVGSGYFKPSNKFQSGTGDPYMEFGNYRTSQAGSFRYLVITAQNCQAAISNPTSTGGVLYRSSDGSTITGRDYVTASESANGYALYLPAIANTSYSYVTVSATNISYGYSWSAWNWFSLPIGGSYGSTLSTSQTPTIYNGQATTTAQIYLRAQAV